MARPLGAQCQVHCTPWMQANTRAAADSQDSCAKEGCGEGAVRRSRPWVMEEAKGDVRFEFPLFIVFT